MRRLAVLACLCAASPAVAAKGEGHRAVVLLDAAALPDAGKLVADYRKRWQRSMTPTHSEKPDVLTFNLDDGEVSIELRRRTVPEDELRDVAHFSWQWPEAKSVQHHAQLNIKVQGPKGDATDNLLRLTRVVASVVATTSVKAVYWGNARMMIEPQRFLRKSGAIERNKPPIEMWVNAIPVELEDQTKVIRTFGMTSANVPELLVMQGELPDDIAMTLVYVTASYLVSHPQAAKTGRLQPAKHVVITIETITSPWDPSEPMLRVVLKI
jgi:hypothetical protein